MITFAFLLAAAQPAGHYDLAGDPPVEMVDFLGRRRECMNRRPPRAPADPDSVWAAYRCADLAAEERAFRTRYAGDSAALAWLDQDPDDFHLHQILVSSYDGPPATRVLRSEQSGTDAERSVTYRLTIDGDAAGGRAAAVTLGFADLPARTVWLDRTLFPHLDSQALDVALRAAGPQRSLVVRIAYGLPRPWCGVAFDDDRGRVTITYSADRGIILHRLDRPNCRSAGEELDPAPFLTPPR